MGFVVTQKNQNMRDFNRENAHNGTRKTKAGTKTQSRGDFWGSLPVLQMATQSVRNFWNYSNFPVTIWESGRNGSRCRRSKPNSDGRLSGAASTRPKSCVKIRFKMYELCRFSHFRRRSKITRLTTARKTVSDTLSIPV